MVGIGDDIKEVFDELGVPAVILRSPANLTEKIVYEVNFLSSNAFLREHLLNASFAYDTVIVPGDLLQFHGNTYIVGGKTPDDFEGEIVENAAVLYKCNFPATAQIVTPTTSVDQTTYAVTSGWTVKAAKAYGLITPYKRSDKPDKELSTGTDIDFEMQAFVPASYGTAINDRLFVSATECYRVQDLEKYRFPGIHVLNLVLDERVVYPTPS